MFDDTIYALSSGSGISAISLIRLTGSQVSDVMHQCFDKKDIKPRYSYYATLKDIDGHAIDDVVFTYFKAPASYTGEDMLEISCHGSPLIRQSIYVLLQNLNIRLAFPGEFSQRAVLNGKMTLTQAEGVNDMIHSRTNNATKLGYKAAHGQVDDLLKPLYDKALQIHAHINVNIDYPEYNDIEVLTNETLLPLVKELKTQLDQLIKVSQRTVNILSGIKVAIVGKPNVGKSSLLNALIHENKAIVTDIEGTTRDVVEGEIVLDDLYIKLLDTAGIRESDSLVEQIGIEKSYEIITNADYVIIVVDESKGLDQWDQQIIDYCQTKEHIIVNNKSDLYSSKQYINICAQDGDIDALIDSIKKQFDFNLNQVGDSTLTNARQLSAAIKANESLSLIVEQLQQGLELDLVDIEFQNFINQLQEIGGDSYQESLLDRIFSSFCVGK